MSLHHHHPGTGTDPAARSPRADASASTTDAPLELDRQRSQRRLAHELSNLLDGGMRNLGLALAGLRRHHRQPPSPADDATLARLEAAGLALRQMATLVRRWIDGPASDADLHHDSRSIAQAVEHALCLLQPAADAHRLSISARVDPQVADLPAGPVYPVLANALRNSVQAMSPSTDPPSQPNPSGPDAHPPRAADIEVHVRLDHDQLLLSVRDHGPGLAPELLGPDGSIQLPVTTKLEGHGLGLALCSDLARAVGGTLRLQNHPDGGALLLLRYHPARSR